MAKKKVTKDVSARTHIRGVVIIAWVFLDDVASDYAESILSMTKISFSLAKTSDD